MPGCDNDELLGVIAAFFAAALSAVAMLQVRSLVHTEKSSAIVIWFSLTASLAGLLTIPFGWQTIDAWQAFLLVSAGICGGVAQIFMTEAYRHAEASTVAPFELHLDPAGDHHRLSGVRRAADRTHLRRRHDRRLRRHLHRLARAAARHRASARRGKIVSPQS